MQTTATAIPPEFQLPAVLTGQGYRLRPETDADIPFLMTLYATTREDELKPVPWTPEQKTAFCAQQFWAQRNYYYDAIKNCRFDVFEQDNRPIGRLYLEEKASRLHIVDIALMPQWRGQGIGTKLLEALHEAARTSGRPVSIMVDKAGRALRLYERLGYRLVKDFDVHVEMEWTPGG